MEYSFIESEEGNGGRGDKAGGGERRVFTEHSAERSLRSLPRQLTDWL